jgi:hypothetical protein
MTREEVTTILLEEARNQGTYYEVKQRVMDRLTGGARLTASAMRDMVQLLNEAQLLLHVKNKLDVSHTFGGPLKFVVYDQSETA